MRSRGKRMISNALRVGVCVAALWFVLKGVTLRDRVVLKRDATPLVGTVVEKADSVTVQRTDGDSITVSRDEIAVDEQGQPRITYGLLTVWANSKKPLLLLALGLYLTVPFFQAARLAWLLAAQRIKLTFWDSVKMSFAGNFLNFATPLGSNAGDVFKAYFVTTHTDRKTEAATTIVLDRVVGLGTLIATVALITTLVSAGNRLAQFRPYVLAILALGVVVLLAYRSPTLREHLVPWRWLERLPAFDQLRRIDNTARTLMGHKVILSASVLVTFVLQVTAIGAYFAIAVALSMDAHVGNVLEYFAYFYTGAVIQSLPGPPQGLGTVELAYRYFFGPFGSPSQILFLAFLVRLVVLAAALPGLLVTLTGSYRPREAPVAADACERDAPAPAPGPVRPDHDLAVAQP